MIKLVVHQCMIFFDLHRLSSPGPYTHFTDVHTWARGECHSDGFPKRYHTAKVFESAHGRARYSTGITQIRGVRREGRAHF